MLWAMAKQGMASPAFTKLTKKRCTTKRIDFQSNLCKSIPINKCICGRDTVFFSFNIYREAMVAVVVWMSIAASQFFFRRNFVKNGGDINDLKYRTPLYPLVPIVAFSLNFITFVSLAFIPDQRIALYCGIPFMVICYILYQVKYKKNCHI